MYLKELISSLKSTNENLSHIRDSIFKSDGYFLIKNFISKDTSTQLQKFWINPEIKENFLDKINNSDVNLNSEPYLYYRNKNTNDTIYCIGLWNKPIDDLTHEIAHSVNFTRNIIMSNPLFYGTSQTLQSVTCYRVCITISSGQVVHTHSDFIEEIRIDQGDFQDYDPSRLQCTLILSDYNKDYYDGGFYFELGDKKKYLNEIGGSKGDLLIWRYNLKHGVNNVNVKNNGIGFIRIIFPTFNFVK